MSIGKWIVVVFILFAGFIGTLVTICVKQDISLVSKDYYREELAYQQQIDRLQRTAALKVRPVINVQHYTVRVTFDSTQQLQKGTLELFCPANTKMDRRFSLPAGKFEFDQDVSGMLPGMYRARLSWTMAGNEYYQEEIINL